MEQLITATGKLYLCAYHAIAFDGGLCFSVIGSTFAELATVFSNPDETATLTFVMQDGTHEDRRQVIEENWTLNNITSDANGMGVILKRAS